MKERCPYCLGMTDHFAECPHEYEESIKGLKAEAVVRTLANRTLLSQIVTLQAEVKTLRDSSPERTCWKALDNEYCACCDTDEQMNGVPDGG